MGGRSSWDKNQFRVPRRTKEMGTERGGGSPDSCPAFSLASLSHSIFVHFSLILVLSFYYPHSFLSSFPLFPLPTLPPIPGSPPDEVYAQKMKYKAISEELDNALNDITSL